MKRFSEYFYVSVLMLGSLLLQYDPASAGFSDTMVHHGNGSGTPSSGCVSHMADPTTVSPTNPATFKICKANSSATEWAVEIRRNSSPYLLVTGCSVTRSDVPQNPPFHLTWSCTLPQSGIYYRGTITYWVGTTMYVSAIDKRFFKP
jgi:hypothetical protein